MMFQKIGKHRVMIGLLGLLLLSGAGKSRTKAPEANAITQAKPVRHVKVQPVWTRPFTFPNGSKIDLHYDLDTMLRTALTEQGLFAPTDGSEPNPCDIEIQIRAAVSTAEFFNTELGLRFGYAPDGDLGNLTGVRGQITARIGTLGMDFSVWQCVLGKCSAVSSVRADTKTTTVDGNLQIDLALITTGPSFISHTKFGEALRGIMKQGVERMANSTRLNELTWQARVREVRDGGASIVFDAGSQRRIQKDQRFTVYAMRGGSGEPGAECSVYLPVAHIRTIGSESLSSTAVVETILDARGVMEGDVVTVR